MKKILLINAFLFFVLSNVAFAATLQPPKGITVTNITDTSAVITWNPPSASDSLSIAGYNIANHLFVGSEKATVTTNNLTYTVTGLTKLTPYKYYVTAVAKSTQDSSSSQTGGQASFTTLDTPKTPTAPSAPTNLHIVSITTTGGTVAWNAVTSSTGIKGYNVYYKDSTATGNSTKVNSCALITTTSCLLTGLSNTKMWSISVEAVDNNGKISTRTSMLQLLQPGSSGSLDTTPGGSGSLDTTPGGSGSLDTTPGGSGSFVFNVEVHDPLEGSGITDIQTLFNKIVDAILLFAVPVIVVLIIYAGFLFVTAQGNEARLKTAKATLQWTLVGAAIILGAKVITTILSSTIVNILSGK